MHAILAPSSAHRWVNCPGSVQAEQKYPDVETEESREGTAAHELAAELVGRAARAGGWNWSEFDGKAASNGVVFTEEMFDGAVLYAEDVQCAMRDTSVFGGDSLKVEEPVVIPRVHDLNWGTPDCRIRALQQFKLIVHDYKFGRVAVESRENWQAIDYSIGELDEVLRENPKLTDQMITIEIRIVQPRAFHVEGVCREWTVTGSDLRGYANQLKHSAELSQTENPPCKAGPWCRNCSAQIDCQTNLKAVSVEMEWVEKLTLHEMSAENKAVHLRQLMKSADLINDRLKAADAEGVELVKGGTVLPGFGIGHGRGSVVWNKPDAEVIALGDLMNINLRKDEKPITPTQAKKLNVDEAVINSYSEKRQGTARLVLTEETIASRIFSK